MEINTDYMKDTNGCPLNEGDFVKAKNNKIYRICFGEYLMPTTCPDCGYMFERPQDEDDILHFGFYLEDKFGCIESFNQPWKWAQKLNEE